MNFTSFAECRTYQFSFGDGDALYTDHHGERVLADVEGAGVYSLVDTPTDLKLFADELPAQPKQRTFRESFVATSTSHGPSLIAVERGDHRSNYRPQVFPEKFDGCGWILDAKAIFSVDGIVDDWNGQRPVTPIPVQRHAEGSDMQIAKVDGKFETVARLAVNDEVSLKAANWQVQNASKLFEVRSELPGAGPLTGTALSHLNRSRFIVEIRNGCEAIVIRKLYDAFHGRQRARVLVDDKPRGWWYEPIEDRKRRWRWGHIGFRLEKPTSRVAITIDPPAGSPLWSVSQYEILGYFP